MIQKTATGSLGFATTAGTQGIGLSPTDHRSGAMQVAVLALNRNYQAVHVVSVRRAFCLLYKNLAEVIHCEQGQYVNYDFDSWQEMSEMKVLLGEGDDDDWIRAVNFSIQVPRIIRLQKYDRLPRNVVKFNRRNIFLRDEHCCQYCGVRFPTQQLSLDHVMPRSRGGPTSWENIVCACVDCNVRKGGRTPKEARMNLLREPSKPARNPQIVRQLTDGRYAIWHSFLPHVND
ncbi:MAG: HNH endonuclease [Planctomycetaceae bacterium]